MYRPQKAFTTTFMVLNPTISKVMGKVVKEYPLNGELIYGSFVTFGGTEVIINGVWSLQETANIETWYRPDITSETRLKRVEDGRMFKVVGDPEDIEFRHQFLKFKVESYRGSSHG